MQARGGDLIEVHAGQTVYTAPGEEHWHGATPDDFMEHIAMFENSDDPDATTDWGPHVSDEEYNTTTQQCASPESTLGTPMIDQPRQVGGGRRAIGDVAPKLAELTDDVLFEDVWNRPELSARDRSLITVTALITGGSAD